MPATSWPRTTRQDPTSHVPPMLHKIPSFASIPSMSFLPLLMPQNNVYHTPSTIPSSSSCYTPSPDLPSLTNTSKVSCRARVPPIETAYTLRSSYRDKHLLIQTYNQSVLVRRTKAKDTKNRAIELSLRRWFTIVEHDIAVTPVTKALFPFSGPTLHSAVKDPRVPSKHVSKIPKPFHASFSHQTLGVPNPVLRSFPTLVLGLATRF